MYLSLIELRSKRDEIITRRRKISHPMEFPGGDWADRAAVGGYRSYFEVYTYPTPRQPGTSEGDDGPPRVVPSLRPIHFGALRCCCCCCCSASGEQINMYRARGSKGWPGVMSSSKLRASPGLWGGRGGTKRQHLCDNECRWRSQARYVTPPQGVPVPTSDPHPREVYACLWPKITRSYDMI